MDHEVTVARGSGSRPPLNLDPSSWYHDLTSDPVGPRVFPREKHGLQCGFCTPSVIMTAVDFLWSNPDPAEKEIRHAIEGTTAVAAIQAAAATLRDARPVTTASAV